MLTVLDYGRSEARHSQEHGLLVNLCFRRKRRKDQHLILNRTTCLGALPLLGKPQVAPRNLYNTNLMMPTLAVGVIFKELVTSSFLQYLKFDYYIKCNLFLSTILVYFKNSINSLERKILYKLRII